MGAPLIQPSFTGGELSPSLYARVDLARYGTSLRTARNMIVQPEGGVLNRPGTRYCDVVDDHAVRGRLIPFIYSTEVAYLIELGDEVMRFFVAGALLVDGGDVPVTVVTPWAESDLPGLRFTQSADVMYFGGTATIPPQKLTRTSSTTFVLEEFEPHDGPFRDLNSDEAVYMTASSATGNTTLTTNVAVFTADMVGSFVYLEQKELARVKPWTQGEREIVVGDLRRSDGKVYKAVTVPSSTDWTETGSWRPTHDAGRAWDGGADERTNTVQTWKVGIEWEYQHSGYGIVQITAYSSATSVSGVVVRQLPDSVVGGIGSPGTTWTLSGNGVTKVFATAGAVSPTQSDYTVTIGGVPVQHNPFYTPPSGSGPNGPGQEAAP